MLLSGVADSLRTNQSPASSAAAGSVPGSSNRCVAPGTTAQVVLAAHHGGGAAVEVQDGGVQAAYDEQGRRAHQSQAGPGEVGASAGGLPTGGTAACRSRALTCSSVVWVKSS